MEGNSLSEENVPSCSIVGEALSPPIFLCQLLGIAPIQFARKIYQRCGKTKPSINISSSARGCWILRSDWLSPPSIFNLGILLVLITMSFWIVFNISTVFSVFFVGTDVYAFSVQTVAAFTLASSIAVNSCWKKENFVRIWDSIHSIFAALNANEVIDHLRERRCSGNCSVVMITSFRKLKKFAISFIIITMALDMVYALLFVRVAYKVCFLANDKEVENVICPGYNFFMLAEKVLYTIIEIFQIGISLLFAVLCFSVAIFYNEVSTKLTLVLAKGATGDHPKITKDLEKLRICFHKIGSLGELIGNTFGIPILGVCATSVVSIILTVYVYMAGVQNSNFHDTVISTFEYSLKWSLHSMFAIVSVGIILFGGQIVHDCGEKSLKIIRTAPHRKLPQEALYEMSLFTQFNGSRDQPGISACKIATIGLHLLPGLIANITTYMLVLLQFRLQSHNNVQ